MRASFGFMMVSLLVTVRTDGAAKPSRVDLRRWLDHAESVQISRVESPSEEHPFASAIHFCYDAARGTAWLAGDSYFKGLVWSKRTVSPGQRDGIREALDALRLEAEGKPTPEGSSVYRVTIGTSQGNRVLEWKGYGGGDAGTRSGRAARFLENLIASRPSAPVRFAPFDGEVRLKLDCNSLTNEGQIRVAAENGGRTAARLRPVFDERDRGQPVNRIVAYWGYLPSAMGDAARGFELPPGGRIGMTWNLDLSRFRQSAVRTQLLFLAEGLVDTGVPDSMAPLFVSIHGCDLPGHRGAKAKADLALPPSFDETRPPADARKLTSLSGVWSFHEKGVVGATYYLIVGERPGAQGGPDVLFLGAENFGEHGVVYYATRPTKVAFNSEGQLRLQLGRVDYYSNAFSPKRTAPLAGETARGSGTLDLRFEGSWSGESLALRCFSSGTSDCPAPVFTFVRE
jgi:hypothetical protein